jgi:hypothetical protein
MDVRNYWGKPRYPILEHFHPHPLFGPLLMLIIPPSLLIITKKLDNIIK